MRIKKNEYIKSIIITSKFKKRRFLNNNEYIFKL